MLAKKPKIRRFMVQNPEKQTKTGKNLWKPWFCH